MKHIFVINPKAGKKDITKVVTEQIKNFLDESEYLIYVTTGVLDAKEFVQSYCELHQGEELRFYSCGGDGTLNEVVNGVIGFDNVSVACYPSGSGNDFIKYFNFNKADFQIGNLISGSAVDVDLLKFEDRYVINICNIGFDANVAERMIKYKRLPLVSGKGAYLLGVAVSFFTKLSRQIKVTIDDKVVFDGEGLLCAVANSICYGGGFYCTPQAKVDDGLIDVVIVKKVSRPKFVKLIKFYKKGTHLEEPKIKQYIEYEKGTKIEIECPTTVNYAIDGEMGKGKNIKLSIVPKALKFILPNLN